MCMLSFQYITNIKITKELLYIHFFVPNVENPMVFYTHGISPLRPVTFQGWKTTCGPGYILGSADLMIIVVTLQRVSNKCPLNKWMTELRINLIHRNGHFSFCKCSEYVGAKFYSRGMYKQSMCCLIWKGMDISNNKRVSHFIYNLILHSSSFYKYPEIIKEESIAMNFIHEGVYATTKVFWFFLF